MKKILISVVCLAILGITFSLMGTSSVSDAPASADKGTGCYVTGDGLNYYPDENCSTFSTLKFDDEGNFQFAEIRFGQ